MPTYTGQINVNVPGLGDRTFTLSTANGNAIVAPDIDAAIVQAKALVIVTALAAQQTAP